MGVPRLKPGFGWSLEGTNGTMTRWRLVAKRLMRKIWFRAGLFSIFAVLLALASRLVAPLIPTGLDINIGQDAVDRILQILASSMLAVTTFSLTAMVQAYSAATTLGTPRATQLLIEDRTSQNALSTFLGAFLFSIVGIIALSTGYYGQDGRIILFLGTVAVILIIALTLLRWISHITSFGRMADVMDRAEDAATEVIRGYAADPYLGGRPAVPVPSGAVEVSGEIAGYVTHLAVRRLEHLAGAGDLRVHVLAGPGTLVYPGRALVAVEGEVDEDMRVALLTAFTVERHRTFDQDPRLGFIVLSEVASRALSPAVNDPGTAIEVLNALQRCFLPVLLPPEGETAEPAEHVFVPAFEIADLIEAAYTGPMRDGAAMIEVQIRLQKTVAGLAAVATEPGDVAAFRSLAKDALARAEAELDYPEDREALRKVHRELWR